MRNLARLLIAAIAITGCGSPPPTSTFTVALPSVRLTGAVRNPVVLTSRRTLAHEESLPVRSLVQLAKIPTNQGELGIVFWGTRDPSTHAIAQVTEAQVLGMGNPAGSVHVFFDEQMRPVLFRDDASGYSIVIVHETKSRQRVTLCSSSFTALAQTTVTRTDSGPLLGPVASGGSCALATNDLRTAHGKSTGGCSGDASSTKYQLCELAKLITAGSYVAGLGFAIAAIAKFYAHKPNPKPVPISVPIALLFIAAGLIFIPAVFRAIGQTLFESSPKVVDGILPSYVPERSLPGCSAAAPPGTCPFRDPEPARAAVSL